MGFVVFKGYGETHTAPVGVPTLSTLSVGSIVKIDEGGTPVEYLVVNQGIPEDSALYDASCNGTWLLRKELIGLQKWNSTENDYELSDIHAYLNGDFLDLYDYNVRSLIKEVKIPYHKGNGSYGTMASGAEGLPVKSFLLGGYEVGFTTDTHLNFPVDGAVLAYFKNSSNRIAEISGTRYRWWTRSANTHNTNGVWAVETNGTHIGDHTYANDGVRPAVILPSDTPISQNDDGSVNLIVPEISLPPIGTSLEDMTWGQVRAISDAGKASEYFSVGDTKTVTLNGTVGALTFNNETYNAFIIGIDHNESVEGKGIHFQFGKAANGSDIAFCDNGYGSAGTTDGFRFNLSNSGAGGWKSSYMRSTICPAFKSALPSDLQAAISPCVKYTDNVGTGNAASSVTQTNDSIFLLAEYEVHGKWECANSSEQNYQEQYRYYADGNSKAKHKHNSLADNSTWMLRSVHYTTPSYVSCVSPTDGISYMEAHRGLGFAPCFKIGGIEEETTTNPNGSYTL